MPRPYAAPFYSNTAVGNMYYPGRTATGWYNHIPAPDMNKVVKLAGATGRQEGINEFYDELAKARAARAKAAKDKKDEKNKATEDLGNEPESPGFWSKLADIGETVFNKTLDVASTFGYASANAAKYLAEQDKDAPGEELNFWQKLANTVSPMGLFTGGVGPGNIIDDLNIGDVGGVAKAWGRGFAHKDHTTFAQVIAKGAKRDPRQNIYDNKWYQGGMGLTGDILYDPTTYIGVGLITKPLKAHGLLKGADELSEYSQTLGKFADDVDELKINAVHPRTGAKINLTRDVVYSALGGHRVQGGKILNSAKVGGRVKANQAKSFTDSYQFIHDAIRQHPEYNTNETIRALDDEVGNLKKQYHAQLGKASHDAYREVITEQAAKQADALPVGPEEFAQELGDIVDHSIEHTQVVEAFGKLGKWYTEKYKAKEVPHGSARTKAPHVWDKWNKERHAKFAELLDNPGFLEDPQISDEFRQTILDRLDQEVEPGRLIQDAKKRKGVISSDIGRLQDQKSYAVKAGDRAGATRFGNQIGRSIKAMGHETLKQNEHRAKFFMAMLREHVDDADWTEISDEYKSLSDEQKQIEAQLSTRGAHDRTPGTAAHSVFSRFVGASEVPTAKHIDPNIPEKFHKDVNLTIASFASSANFNKNALQGALEEGLKTAGANPEAAKSFAEDAAKHIENWRKARISPEQVAKEADEAKRGASKFSRIEHESTHDVDSSGAAPQDVENTPGAPVGRDQEGQAFDETDALKRRLREIKSEKDRIVHEAHLSGLPLETPAGFRGDVSKFLAVDEHGSVHVTNEKLNPAQRRWAKAVAGKVQQRVTDLIERKRQTWLRSEREKAQYSAKGAHFKDAFGGKNGTTPKIHIDGEEYLLTDLKMGEKGKKLRSLLSKHYTPAGQTTKNVYRTASVRKNALEAFVKESKYKLTDEQVDLVVKALGKVERRNQIPGVIHQLLKDEPLASGTLAGKPMEFVEQELSRFGDVLHDIGDSFAKKSKSGDIRSTQWGDAFDEVFEQQHGKSIEDLKQEFLDQSKRGDNAPKSRAAAPASVEHQWRQEALKEASAAVNKEIADGGPIKDLLTEPIRLSSSGLRGGPAQSGSDINKVHNAAVKGVEAKHEDTVLAVVADSPVGQKFLISSKIPLKDKNAPRVEDLKTSQGYPLLDKDPELVEPLNDFMHQFHDNWTEFDGRLWFSELHHFLKSSYPEAFQMRWHEIQKQTTKALGSWYRRDRKKSALTGKAASAPNVKVVTARVSKAARKNPNDPELQKLDNKIKVLEDLRKYEINTLNKGRDEAIKTREALADRMKEQITLNMLEESLREGKNYIGLKIGDHVLHKDVTIGGKSISLGLIPDFLHLTEATERIATVPILQAANKIWSQTFSPSSTLEPELNLARLRVQNRTPELIAFHVERLRNTFGKYKPTDRKRAFKVLKMGGKLRSELSDSLDQEFEDFVHWLNNAELPIEGGTATERISVRELNRFLPENFQIKQAEGYSDERIQINNSKQLIDHLRRLQPNADPLQVLWRLRIAAEQAMAHKGMLIEIREMFGVKRVLGDFDHVSVRDLNEKKQLIEDMHHLHDWREVRDIGHEYYFAPEMADQIERLMVLMKPQNIHEITRLFDKTLRGLKSFMTVYNPGYYTRNGIGETIMGMMDGVGPKAYSEAVGIMRYGTTDDVKEALKQLDPWSSWAKRRPTGTKSVVKLPYGGPELSQADIWVLYHQSGLKTGFISQEFEHQFPTSGSLAATPVGKAGKLINDSVRDKGEKFEDYFRMAHFVSRLSRSKIKDPVKAAEEAANYVRKYHFDYTDFTPFEKTTMMRLFPFYKWTKKALPLMTSMLFTRPGMVTLYPKAMQNASYAMGGTDPQNDPNGFLPNYEKVTPEWVKGLFAYPMGKDEEGNMSYMNVANPAFDIYKMLKDPVGGGIGMLNPMIKNPIEQIQGNTMDPDFKISFTEKPKYEGAQTNWSKRLDNLLRITPQTGYVNQLQKGPGLVNDILPGDSGSKESQWSEPNGRPDERTAGFFSGLGFYENNDDSKFGELQRKMESGTITDFERHRLGDLLHKYKDAAEAKKKETSTP